MFKTLLFAALIGVSSSFGATFSTISSNQFKIGTNGIYQVSLINLATLSNSINSATYVSSNALVSTNWTAISSTTSTHGSEVVTNSINAGSVLTPALAIGGGTAITKILTGTATLDFPSTATNSISTLTITVSGAGTNGCAFLNIVSPNSAFTYGCTIESTNTVTVRAANISINAVDPAATAARVVVFQY